MRALGVDLGEKRIGIAVSDSNGKVATPLQVIIRSKSIKQDHKKICDLVDEWEADIVVVGMPYSLNGSKGLAAKTVEKEVKELSSALEVPVATQDERLTTVTAAKELAIQGLDSKKQRKVIDQVAASVILQSWLDNRT
ncbi:MAG: Holliday junction resolvase RuvX [Actinomycetota bacterium]|jgi:putative Holliday junction resolvase|nr:Holliday junction resolvase RuvX [Actinomycetota bacterium]|tara:strand:+ start:11110 stop:11523 length:414 start_codon:yes stop_codon:yes gene_type:complete